MESLEICVRSASGLKDLNTLGTMDPYVTVTLSNDPRSKQKTEVHTDGGKNPKWRGKPMRFAIDMSRMQNVTVVFTIMAEKPFGDKEVGEVIVPVKEFFQGDPQMEKSLSYSVSTPSGKPKGTLNFSYKVIKNPNVYDPKNLPGGYGTPMAVGPGPSNYGPVQYPPQNQYGQYPPQQQYYPPPPPQQGYPPQPPQGAYAYPHGGGPPPQGGYAYPQAPGYPSGHGNQQQQMKHGGKKPKSKKGGLLGLGALGIGAGLVGGMLLGDMVGDVASGFGDIAGDVASGFGDVASGFGDIAGGIVGDVGDFGGGVYESAGTFYSDVGDSMSTLGSIG